MVSDAFQFTDTAKEDLDNTYIFEKDKKVISILRIVYGRRNLDEILKLI